MAAICTRHGWIGLRPDELRGERRFCIARCSADFRWWQRLLERYVRRHKLTITHDEAAELGGRIEDRANRIGYRVSPRFRRDLYGPIGVLAFINGEEVNHHKLPSYIASVVVGDFMWIEGRQYVWKNKFDPEGDYCPIRPLDTCLFCGGPHHRGIAITGGFCTDKYFCSDRCKRAHGLLYHGMDGGRRGGNLEELPRLIWLLAEGIKSGNPVAMKVLQRRSAKNSEANLGCNLDWLLTRPPWKGNRLWKM